MSSTAESLPRRNDKRQLRPQKPRLWRRRWPRYLALALVTWWGFGFLAAFGATQAHPRRIKPRARIGEHAIENVEVVTPDGLTVRGWLVDVPPPQRTDERRCVILCAGIRGNRQRMVARAAFYHRLAWSTLLVDLRGTGASDSARVAMGWHEAIDLLSWQALLRQRGYTTVGVHGQSLGAAAAAFTSVRTQQPPPWSFMVLEACYLDIGAALQARIPLPQFLLWPIYVNAEWLLGVDAEDLSPLAAMRRHTAPTFFACGEWDHKVGPCATELLVDALPVKDKVHYEVPRVGHGDLWGPGGAGLRDALREFLSRR